MLSDLDSNVEPPRKAVEFVPENSSASFAPAAVNYSDKAVYRLPPLLTTSSLRGLRSPTLPQDANRERSSSFRPVRGATVFSEANPSAKTEGFLHSRRGQQGPRSGKKQSTPFRSPVAQDSRAQPVTPRGSLFTAALQYCAGLNERALPQSPRSSPMLSPDSSREPDLCLTASPNPACQFFALRSTLAVEPNSAIRSGLRFSGR